MVTTRIARRGLILRSNDLRYMFLMKNATLAAEDVVLCHAVLSQELMKISELLSSGKDPDGEELTRDSRLELMGYRSRLQLTMISLGMDSAEIERIIKNSSPST
jgi:hypothetical protein